ncbi:MAG: hypothetical protein ABID64_01180 [Nitrospirota bacterium]
MEREKKKTIVLAALIGLAIVVAIFIFLWGAYLNRGTVNIIATPPFKVVTLDDEYLCDISPCEIVRKRGITDMIVSKAGFQNISTSIDVKLWGTVDLELKFMINPYIEVAEAFPEADPIIGYEIVLDEQTNSYKLIREDDDQQRPIVYFLKEIPDPRIFGSEKGALIVDNDIAYKIDIENAERDRINENFSAIEGGVWSNDGEKFAYTTSDSSYVQVLDQFDETYETELLKENTIYTWNYDNDLFYITSQDNSYIFGIFNPEAESYTQIFASSEFTELPNTLIPTNNGNRIYFKIGEEKFVLILEKF